MTSDRPNDRSPRRRVQFTVRTFFVAAVLVSLFAAAASEPAREVRIFALTLLAWVTFAGLYWTLRWTGPLVALPVGTLLLGLLWGIQLLFGVPEDIRHTGIWGSISVAFAWGILFSLLVGLSRMIRWLRGWLKGRFWGRRQGQSPFRQDATPAQLRLGYAGYLLFTRVVIAVLLLSASILIDREWRSMGALPASISLLVDMPVAPLVIGVFYPSAPDSSVVFLLATAPLSCPLYAGAGWIVGAILARLNRRAVPIRIRAGLDR